jgi:hypothetical protein
MWANNELLKTKFDQGIGYDDFVELGRPEGHDGPWRQRYSQLELSPTQRELVESFTRSVNILCLTGTWCGDCALQGSAMQRIAQANPGKLNLRFVLRCDEHADLVVKSQINAGYRVPVTWFLSEDFQLVSCFGDRTLSRYRSMALKALGPQETASIQAPPSDPVRHVLQEVLDEFERAALLLRLSTRLRQKHGD